MQPTKTAVEGNDVLDRHYLILDDDALDQEAYEPLPAGEVQAVDAVGETGGERLDVVGDLVEVVLSHLVGLELLSCGAELVVRCRQPFAACLELLDGESPRLIGVDESLDLKVDLARRFVEARTVLRALCR